MKMTIGLTFDLRSEYVALGYTNEEQIAEFDREETVEGIERTLQDIGYITDRIGHAKQLVTRLAKGDRWDLVFNIAEGLYGFGREALIPALLDTYQIPYTFSDPLALSLTLHKAMTKHVIRDLGIPTPDFVLVEERSDIEKVNLPFPLFAKPVAEGTGKGITEASKLTTQEELYKVCQILLEKHNQPVLIEQFLPGKEFTIGVLGTGKSARVIGPMEVIFKSDAERDVYSFHNKENYERLVEYSFITGEIAQKAKELALAAWRGLGCRDAGRMDLREDDHGILNFIEVNPLAGIRPIHADLCILCNFEGISYRELIETIVNSAMKRIKK
jgi:D-alanine-D-alanine ligase